MLLLVLLGAALAVLAWLWLNPSRPSMKVGGTESAAEQAAIKPLGNIKIASLEGYQEIIERPLFYDTRRPPPPEDNTPEPPPALPEEPDAELLLMGVMLTPEGTSALVRNEDTGKVQVFKVGDQSGEWTLQTVKPDEVVFGKGEEEKTLLLERNKRKPTLTRQQIAQRTREQQQAQQQQNQQQNQQPQDPSQEQPQDQSQPVNEQEPDAAARLQRIQEARRQAAARRAERAAAQQGTTPAESDPTQNNTQ